MNTVTEIKLALEEQRKKDELKYSRKRYRGYTLIKLSNGSWRAQKRIKKKLFTVPLTGDPSDYKKKIDARLDSDDYKKMLQKHLEENQ